MARQQHMPMVVPLTSDPSNLNTETALQGQMQHVLCDTSSNVYGLPSKAEIIQHLHVAEDSPTKTKVTFLDAIRAGGFQSLHGITVELVNKYFLESDDI